MRALLIGSVFLATSCVDKASQVPIVVRDWCDQPRSAEVACVLDGDTIDVGACGDTGERIRLLGVAAPEIAHPGEAAECFGDASHAFLEEVLAGRRVQLSFDVECTDLYGRTLAWVELEGDSSDSVVETLEDLDNMGIDDDGGYSILVNELMVRSGHAEVFRGDIAEDVRYEDQLDDAEDLAEEDALGMWAEDACE